MKIFRFCGCTIERWAQHAAPLRIMHHPPNHHTKGSDFEPDDLLDEPDRPEGPLRDLIFRPVYLTPRYVSYGALINCESLSEQGPPARAAVSSATKVEK